MFTYKENGEANLWIILLNNNWYMTIRFNGELMEAAPVDLQGAEPLSVECKEPGGCFYIWAPRSECILH